MSKARSTGNIGNIIKTSTTCVTVTDGTTDLLIMSGSGRVTIPGDLVVLGGIAGSSAESASYSLSSSFATNANLLDGIDGASFLQTGSFNTFSSSIDTTIKNKLNGDGVISGSAQVDITSTTGYSTFSSSLSSSIGSLSGSVATTTSELSSSIGSLSSSVATTTSGLAGRITTIEGNYATTGSNVFVGNQVITGSICSTGNIVTTGQIVAQTINVQQVTSSIVYSCGSNVFGTDINNTQQFTGSMLMTGSNFRATVGTACFSGNVCAPAFVGGTVSGTSGTFSGNLSLQGAVTRNINFYDDTCTNINAQIQYDQISSNSGQFLFKTNNAGTLGTKLTIANTGVATFACSVSANSLNINTSTVFAKANISDALTATSIGTNYNPGILNIQNSNTTNGNLSLIGFQDANAFINLAAVGAINDIHSASPNSVVGSLGFYTKASGGAYITEKMRINGDGNVGIGTCTPVGKLDVTLVNTRRFIVTYDDSIITIKGASDTGAGENLRIIGDNLIFNTNSVGSGTERMRITSTGISCFACQVCAPNLLISNCATIGTVGFSYPEFRLAVTPIMTVVGAGCAPTGEGIYFKRTSNLCQGGWISGNGGALYIIGQNKHSTAFGDIYISTNNGTTTCDIMVIDGPNQRVGIGTTTPYAKFEVLGGNQCPPSTGTQNYTMALRDPTSMVCGVGGSILFQGYKTGTAAIGNFAYIAGKKENGTAGNEAGYISLGNFDSAGNVGERMRISSASCGGVVRIGTCTINWNTNSNVALQVAGAIKFGNPDGDYVPSYGGGISARTLSTFAPGSFAIIVKGLGGSGFLYQVQGFTLDGVRFTDLLFGVNNTFSVIASQNENGPAARAYTITSENLNICIGGSATYSAIIAHGFGAVER